MSKFFENNPFSESSACHRKKVNGFAWFAHLYLAKTALLAMPCQIVATKEPPTTERRDEYSVMAVEKKKKKKSGSLRTRCGRGTA